ncbi:MAG: radical SAM protein [Nitrospinae bacterium]|nr:radical SAM protein [Nitrospinota bacterium]
MFKPLLKIAKATSIGKKVKKSIQRNGFLLLLYKVILQRMIDYAYPPTFNIEPTNACNLTCRMCPRENSRKGIGFMDMGLFTKIIDESVKYEHGNFILHKDGEPLLHKDIGNMMRIIRNKNKKSSIYISTNGIALTEEIARSFIETGLDRLNISIDAVIPETYKKVKGGMLDRVEKNVENLLALKKKLYTKKPLITLQIIKMEETLNEIDGFVKKWSKYDVDISILYFRTWGSGAKSDITLKEQNTKKRYPCHALWFSPAINWNGEVSLCCADWNCDEIIGNVNKQTLSEIWQNEKLYRYRKYHLLGEYDKIPICKDCNYWQEAPDIWFWWQKK